MTFDYSKVWEVMNELEMVTSKVCSAREILDSAIDSLESGNREKAETLMYATDEFLQYYLKDFDEKFKVAWKEIVIKLKNQEYNAVYECHKDNSSSECKSAWTSFWEESSSTEDEIQFHIDPKGNEVPVKKWVLPVQEIENGDTMENEYFINLPDDLLERAGLKENDVVEWVDNGNGTYTLRHKGMSNTLEIDKY